MVKQSLKSTAIIAIVSATIGGTVSGIAVNKLNNNQNGSITNSGTTKITPTKVSSTNPMGAAFNKVSGAVVSVVNYQKNSNSENQTLEALLGKLYGEEQTPSDSDEVVASSEGSGVIYSKSNGKSYIATNNHVVKDAEKLEVILKDGTKVPAKLVGTDETTDLAVLEISSDKVTTVAEFGDSNKVTEGDTVIAIGSPLGSEYATSVTEGIISSKSRTLSADTSSSLSQPTVIQTDAAINPGNSGGPLVNSSGQVIGINSMKLSQNGDGTAVEGMGFAIPSNEVVKIINQLVKNGKVKRPSLGVKVVDLSQISQNDQKDVLKLPNNIKLGVVLMDVTKNDPAQRGGLKKYDVITSIGGKQISGVSDLFTQLNKHSIGDNMNITFYRDGKEQKTTINLNKEA